MLGISKLRLLGAVFVRYAYAKSVRCQGSVNHFLQAGPATPAHRVLHGQPHVEGHTYGHARFEKSRVTWPPPSNQGSSVWIWLDSHQSTRINGLQSCHRLSVVGIWHDYPDGQDDQVDTATRWSMLKNAPGRGVIVS